MDLKAWFRRRFTARILWTPCGYCFPHSDVMCGYTAHHFDNFSQLIRPAERVMLVSIYYSIYCLPPPLLRGLPIYYFTPPCLSTTFTYQFGSYSAQKDKSMGVLQE